MSNRNSNKKDNNISAQSNKFAVLNSCGGSKIKVYPKQEEEKSVKKIIKNKESKKQEHVHVSLLAKMQEKKSEPVQETEIFTKKLAEEKIPPETETFVQKVGRLIRTERDWKPREPSRIHRRDYYRDPEGDKCDRLQREFRGGNSEQRELYIDNPDKSKELGNVLYLNSPWTVWIHKLDCKVWTEDSYTNVYVIDSIGSFWRFFNNFHMLDKIKNQFFIMRNKIKPIWEDNDNRSGGICSIKLDCFSKQGKIDIGIEIMICVCMLVMNETFVQNSEEVNGISYSIKNRSVLIKLWTRNYAYKITDKLPIGLFSKLDTIMRNMDKSSFARREENKVSIRYTQIEPEDSPQF